MLPLSFPVLIHQSATLSIYHHAAKEKRGERDGRGMAVPMGSYLIMLMGAAVLGRVKV